MDISKPEYAALREAAQIADESSLKELSELELLLVGGGSGDVVIG